MRVCGDGRDSYLSSSTGVSPINELVLLQIIFDFYPSMRWIYVGEFQQKHDVLSFFGLTRDVSVKCL
jgi:hypothetical protein